MTQAAPERHLASHVFNIVVLVLGTVGLAVMMHRLGLASFEEVVRDAGGWLALVVSLDLAALALDAAAIHAFMRPEARMVSYWRVLAAQSSGRAISILTPGGALGEATKIAMLVGHAPRERVVSSIVLFNLATFYLSVAIVAVGVPLTTSLVDLPHELSLAVWIGLGVLALIVGALALVIHRGAAGTATAAARELRFVSPERAARWRERLTEIDRHLRELHSERSPGTHVGFALLATSRALQWCATITVLHAIGLTLTPRLLVGVLSVGVLIGWMSAVVPFGVGVADGSNYALYRALGAGGAPGVLVTLLGRARSLVIATLGLVVMAAGHTANRLAISRRNAAIASRHAATLRSEE